jgi:hypothetical protein
LLLAAGCFLGTSNNENGEGQRISAGFKKFTNYIKRKAVLAYFHLYKWVSGRFFR